MTRASEHRELAQDITQEPARRPSRFAVLSFQNISAVYVLAALLILFAFIVPDTFFRATTFQSLAYEQAVTALLAVGLILPLSAGVYDLSVGTTIGMSSVVVSLQIVNHHQPIAVAIAIALAVGVAIGVLNGILVVFFKIDSFIATLAMSSVLTGFAVYLTGDQQIVGLPRGFQGIAINKLWGLTWSVYILLAVALIVWYITEHTPLGRFIYATGGGRDSARLSGVRTERVVFGSLVASALIAAMAGVIVTARIGTGDQSVGPPYLLPAFAATFLGATQLRNGRFNVWGTIIATYVLAAGVKGLQLAGAPFWLPSVFNGVALASAVGLAGYQGRTKLGKGRRWRRRVATSVQPADGALPAEG